MRCRILLMPYRLLMRPTGWDGKILYRGVSIIIPRVILRPRTLAWMMDTKLNDITWWSKKDVYKWTSTIVLSTAKSVHEYHIRDNILVSSCYWSAHIASYDKALDNILYSASAWIVGAAEYGRTVRQICKYCSDAGNAGKTNRAISGLATNLLERFSLPVWLQSTYRSR